jgi:hypothetical protein
MLFAYIALLAAAAFLILAVLLGRRRFHTLVMGKVTALLSDPGASLGPDDIAARRDTLPDPVRRYLRYAVPEGAPAIHNVRLKHDGFFRTKPGPRWFAIEAEEHFTVEKPGFVWNATIRPAPLLWIEACDSLLSGKGRMLIKFNSTLTIADATGAEMDQGAALRWLAEAIWFPVGFAGGRVRWEPIDGRSARATLLQDGLPVSVVIEIDEEGKLVYVRGKRYRDTGGGKAALTPWIVRCSDYRDFSGFRVPSYGEVAWDLEDGEFTYARFRVKSLEYNV